MEFIRNLQSSLHLGFIDHTHNEYGSYKPSLLVNDVNKNESVLTSIIEELTHCESFIFVVAFITEGGLATLKSHFLNLKNKGINGRIITSTYLYFNQPKVFRELLKITNLEVRLTNLKGFHSKGYIFNNRSHYSLIVGSSNLTANALKVNYEWNLKLSSHENGELVLHVKNQFEDLWETSKPLIEEWITEYEEEYSKHDNDTRRPRVIELQFEDNTNLVKDAFKITPNKMQIRALQMIESVREAGKNKGLIISATGTGKTYLSAFDVRKFNPKRTLFIVHREQILQKAKSDYRKIIGGYDKDFGILSGTNKESGARFLFATIQTISIDETLSLFDPEEFDYVLIDEVHKAGAKSYLKVIDYFKPKFFMGMTATPERTDDFNIYELFDYNIAYEIRLQEALEEDMLCPFHYFGVTDLEFNGETIDDTTILAKLVTEERVDHIIEKINYYGFSGDTVRGLIFCSRKEEAEKLSEIMNSRGYKTVALTGDHSQEIRSKQVDLLENGDINYIITVDIFNEGIDIPSVNQVIMLRQTQSSIIFIQQLGRGLRKHDSKEYVTIIDFIGNYKNNYLIPIALAGDKSQNKDNIRRRMKDTSYIKGVSTINFEEIAKKLIFNSINNSNLSELKKLKEAYTELKNRLGRVPALLDFIQFNSLDPLVIVNEYSNYHQFLLKIREEVQNLNDYENKVLTMLSCEVLNGKRKHEIILLDLLCQYGKVKYEDYISHLNNANCQTDNFTLSSVQRIFDLSFFTQPSRTKYGEKPIVVLNNNYFEFNDSIKVSLSSNIYFRSNISDIIRTSYEKSKLYQSQTQFTKYEKYTRKDACRLLNWENDESSTIYGYKPKYNSCPIFFTYHKKEDVDSSVAYGDEFLSQDVLRWYTRSNRTVDSEEVKKIIYARENNIDIHIFVKKDDDEGSDFYYLGKALPDKNTVIQASMRDKNQKEIPVVHMNMIMKQSIDSKLYHYIISEN